MDVFLNFDIYFALQELSQGRLADEDEEGHEHPDNVVDLDVDGHVDGQMGGKQNPKTTQKRSWTGE